MVSWLFHKFRPDPTVFYRVICFNEGRRGGVLDGNKIYRCIVIIVISEGGPRNTRAKKLTILLLVFSPAYSCCTCFG